ncbi:uncharacterized protein PSANT_04645 [Moesziomyces antarcticus]|uniref:Uncharacterized protein n=1 Tax=Pseudozyma antarctica TaxID=84753 RepID=A0A5C3FUA6_PSEA2|nr:uncharacterized protein PSANT_04645 [Moesziomyces antarcticus]
MDSISASETGQEKVQMARRRGSHNRSSGSTGYCWYLCSPDKAAASDLVALSSMNRLADAAVCVSRGRLASDPFFSHNPAKRARQHRNGENAESICLLFLSDGGL